MDYRRRAALLLVILCALGATSAFAAPCQPGPLSSYLAPAFTCTEAPFTIKNFSFSESIGGLDPTLIQVIPTITSNQLEFQFLGNFTAGQNQIFQYVFSYFVDAPPIIHGTQDDLDPTGNITLQTLLCGFAACPGGQGMGTITVTTAQPTAQKTLMTDLNALGLQNTLTLNGSNGPATSGGFDNITFLSTPEPAAILLMASGLLCLLGFRSRKKLRQVFLQLRP